MGDLAFGGASDLTYEAAGVLLNDALNPQSAPAATETLKKCTKANPLNVVSMLAQHLATNPEPAKRQLAAVLLRGKISGAWTGIPVEMRATFRQGLVERIKAESVDNVRSSVARVIGAVADFSPPWHQEISEFISTLATSPEVPARRMAMFLTGAILDGPPMERTMSGGDDDDDEDDKTDKAEEEAVKEAVQSALSYLPKHIGVLTQGVRDQDVSVQTEAVTALAANSYLANSTADHQALRQCVGPLAAYLEAAIKDNNDETRIKPALELLLDLVDDRRILDADSVGTLSQGLMGIANQSTLELGFRMQAVEFINGAAKNYPKVFSKNAQLVTTILNGLTQLGCFPETSEVPNYDEDEEDSPFFIASRCVDMLSLNLTPKFFLTQLMKIIKPLSTSTVCWERRWAITCLGTAAEGCCEFMRADIQQLAAWPTTGLLDTSEHIRAASAVSLGQLFIHVMPEITKVTAPVVANCITAIRETLELRRRAVEAGGNDSPACKAADLLLERLCYLAHMLCIDGTPGIVVEAQDILMPLLLTTLTETKRDATKENCLETIAALAESVKEKFTPHVPSVMSIVSDALTSVSGPSAEVFSSVHARAVECAGSVSVAVPMEVFMPYKEQLIAAVNRMLQMHGCKGSIGKCAAVLRGKSTGKTAPQAEEETATEEDEVKVIEIRTCSYRFFSLMLTKFAPDIQALLPDILPFTLASIMYNDANEDDDIDIDSCDDDETSSCGEHALNVRTGALEELLAAQDFLCSCYRFVSFGAMNVYLEETLLCIRVLGSNMVEDVRATAPDLITVVIVAAMCFQPPAWWKQPPANSEDPAWLIAAPELSAIWYEDRTANVLDRPADQYWRCADGNVPLDPASTRINPSVHKLWRDHMWPLCLQTLEEEKDPMVVANFSISFAHLLEVCGPDLLAKEDGFLCEAVCTTIKRTIGSILNGKHACQKGSDIKLLDEDEESRLQEEALLEGVVNLLLSMSQAVGGEQAVRLYDEYQPFILKVATHRKSLAYCCIGIGCYAELLSNLVSRFTATVDSDSAMRIKALASGYVTSILPVVMRCMTNQEDSGLPRNSCYCLGICAVVDPQNALLQSNISSVFKMLEEIITGPQQEFEEGRALVDNATAAVSRLMRSMGPTIVNTRANNPAIPIEAAMELFYKGLPLKEDSEESQEVVEGLQHILNNWPNLLDVNFIVSCTRCLAGSIMKEHLSKRIYRPANPTSASPLVGSGLQAPSVTLEIQLKGILRAALSTLAPACTPENLTNHPVLKDVATLTASSPEQQEILRSLFV